METIVTNQERIQNLINSGETHRNFFVEKLDNQIADIKEKLASHIREISNLKITAGSLTVDNILNGRYNQVPAYLKSKHIERFAHDYTNDLIKFSKKENEALDNYKEILRRFDSESRSIYKEKKKIEYL